MIRECQVLKRGIGSVECHGLFGLQDGPMVSEVLPKRLGSNDLLARRREPRAGWQHLCSIAARSGLAKT